MAFGDTIQTVEGSGSGAASDTVTFSAAVSGNLLIIAVANSAAQTWGTAPTGFSVLSQVTDGSGNMSAIWYWKIAAGGETSFTIAWSNSITTWRWVGCEFEGAFAGSPLDVTAEDETNISTVVTSQASGTTGATAQNDEFAVAFFGADRADQVTDGRAYTNSFAEVVFSSTVDFVARPAIAIAKKVLSATGTQTTTFSTTDTGDEMYGAIGTWKKSVSGTAYFQSVAGSLSSAGAVVKGTGKPLAGTVPLAGTAVKKALLPIGGALATAGTLAKKTKIPLAGVLSLAGSAVKLTQMALAGVLATGGSVTKKTKRALAGTLAIAGSVIKKTKRILAGILSLAGSLASSLIGLTPRTLTLPTRTNTLTLDTRSDTLTLPTRTNVLTLEDRD